MEKVRSYARAVDKLYDFVIEFSRVEQLFVVEKGFENRSGAAAGDGSKRHSRHDFAVVGYPPSLAGHISDRRWV